MGWPWRLQFGRIVEDAETPAVSSPTSCEVRLQFGRIVEDAETCRGSGSSAATSGRFNSAASLKMRRRGFLLRVGGLYLLLQFGRIVEDAETYLALEADSR